MDFKQKAEEILNNAIFEHELKGSFEKALKEAFNAGVEASAVICEVREDDGCDPTEYYPRKIRELKEKI